MFEKETRIIRSFTISIKDLLFEVRHNKLKISKGDLSLETDIREEELEMLEAFCSKGRTILSPIPGNTVVYSIDDGPQKITLLKTERDVYCLIINDQIQFTTDSEIIYHEALVSPAIACLDYVPKNILILGGGDGLAAKQIFKEIPDAKITLVDFDKNITDIFTHDEELIKFNDNSMSKCEVINDDAFLFVKNNNTLYDIIVCDFPDPDDEIFNKLYSLEFYNNLKLILSKNGAVSVQSGSLVNKSKSFQCINKTLEAAGFKTIKYYTPSSYGQLVYSLGKLNEIPKVIFKNDHETLNQEYFEKAMCTFRPDSLCEEEVIINTIDNFAALNYRLEELKVLKNE